MASEIARWVLPTPGGPRKKILSRLVIKFKSKNAITSFFLFRIEKTTRLSKPRRFFQRYNSISI